MSAPTKILVRLPNWLGDLLMARIFLSGLRTTFPGASIDVVVKSNLVGLAEMLPGVRQIHPFNKADFPGPMGAVQFGRNLRKERYQFFFCLPDSFSSALMGWATNSRQRFGYRKEGRSIWLTRSFSKADGQHRSEEYLDLLWQSFPSKRKSVGIPSLQTTLEQTPDLNQLPEKYLVFNPNSVAESRRIPVEKATEIARLLHLETQLPLVLVGGPSDVAHVNSIVTALADLPAQSVAGTTTLPELARVVKAAQLVVSTDSGPAHLAAAVEIPILVIFGAGNEKNTGPLSEAPVKVVRVPGLDCAPCVSNTCRLPQLDCMHQLSALALKKALKDLPWKGVE